MTRHRGWGQGTVTERKKQGGWQAAVTLEDGSRQYRYTKTRQEAEQERLKMIEEIKRGMPVAPDKLTVGDYLARWLVAVKPHLRPRSYVRYQAAVNLHITPALGRIKLAKLTLQQLEAFYAVKLSEG